MVSWDFEIEIIPVIFNPIDINYDIAADPVSNSVIINYDISDFVSNSVNITYDIAADPVSNTLNIIYDIFSDEEPTVIYEKTFNISWSLGQIIEKQIDVSWSIAQPIEKSFDISWSIEGATSVLDIEMDARASLIAVAFADAATSIDAYDKYNVNSVGNATWNHYFSEFSSVGAFNYVRNPNAVIDTGIAPTKTIDIDIMRSLVLLSYNASASGDTAQGDFEFLDINDNVVCAIKVVSGSYSNNLYYGPTLATANNLAPVNGYAKVYGTLSFTNSGLRYDAGFITNVVTNFVYPIDVSAVKKVRVSNLRAISNYTSGTNNNAHLIMGYSPFYDTKGHILLPSIAADIISGIFTGDDYVLIASSDDFNIGTKDFSLKAEVYWDTNPGSEMNIFSLIDNVADTWLNKFRIAKNNQDKLTAYIFNNTYNTYSITNSAIIPISEMTSIELARVNGVYYLYQNNIQVGSLSIPLINHGNSGITIGSAYPNNTVWKGKFGNINLTIG